MILPVGIGSEEAGGFQIERSLRFNSADSAYLSRTPASAGNRKTYTHSFWMKLAAIGTSQYVASNSDNSANNGFGIQYADNILNVFDYSTNYVWQLATTQVFRDPSAWYHFVIAVDTTQATAANRVKIYVNGSQITTFSVSNYPSQNYDSYWNNTSAAAIGRAGSFTGSVYLNSYLTEYHFIDGQALDPTSFGEFNSDTGVWQPKKYTGTYGTNGFYLPFKDNASTTTLGDDFSGNGNDWTTNNFSVTAGAGNDSLVDTPTPYGTDTGAGGEVRGNYATLNPLVGSTLPSYANGNLQVTGPSSSSVFGASYSTIGMTSGKWYAEFTWLASGANASELGVGSYVYPRDSSNQNGYINGITMINLDNLTATSRAVSENGSILTGGDASFSFSVNDIIGIAFDADAKTVSFYKNGSILGSTYPYDVASVGDGVFYFIVITRFNDAASSFAANFGQRPFAFSAPSGFKALVTTNLP